MTDLPEYTLVYLGIVDRFDRTQQLELCEKIVDAIGLAPIGDKIYEHNELDAYISHMKGREKTGVVYSVDGKMNDRYFIDSSDNRINNMLLCKLLEKYPDVELGDIDMHTTWEAPRHVVISREKREKDNWS